MQATPGIACCFCDAQASEVERRRGVHLCRSLDRQATTRLWRVVRRRRRCRRRRRRRGRLEIEHGQRDAVKLCIARLCHDDLAEPHVTMCSQPFRHHFAELVALLHHGRREHLASVERTRGHYDRSHRRRLRCRHGSPINASHHSKVKFERTYGLPERTYDRRNWSVRSDGRSHEARCSGHSAVCWDRGTSSSNPSRASVHQ